MIFQFLFNTKHLIKYWHPDYTGINRILGVIGMKLHFLGTCAGTEPMPERRHACIAVECNDRLYWFDAGEGCSITGHLMGLDLLKVKKVIISHTHMDHVGGLGNLLWNIRKLSSMKNTNPDDIDLYTPLLEVTDSVFSLLENTENRFEKGFEINVHEVNDGVLFDDGCVRVTAFHNQHVIAPEKKDWISFSYLIEAEGKRIVYSGDLYEYNELDRLIGDYCDAVIIETGHFGIDKTYEYLKNKNTKRVYFSHNGREIINFPKESQEKVERYFEGRGTIAEDKMTVEI